MDRDFIEQVREATDIVQLIGEYVQLKRSGKSYRGLCPFHAERTPSFYVSPDKGVYHCFGCGASGNAFRFVMEMEKLSFPEAVEFLARRAGIPIPPRTTRAPGLSKVLEETAAFYHQYLLSAAGQAARAYLEHRGVRQESVLSFQLGLAPQDGRILIRHLLNKGFTRDLLLRSGVALEGQNGDLYDAMRGRLVFPIRTPGGTVVGFGGRTLSESQSPKYLNTRETPLFKKGSLLFGLDRAKTHIRSEGYAVVVEGYIDTLLMHQEGFRNTVAPLGTALTDAHARVIARYTERVYLLFDGDASGVRAAQRSLLPLLSQGIVPQIALIPGERDPADLLKENTGREQVQNLLHNAMSLVSFYFREVPIHDPHARSKAAQELLHLLAQMNKPLLAASFLHDLAERSSIPFEVLQMEFLKLQTTKAGDAPKGTRKTLLSREFLILLYGLHIPRIRERIVQNLEPEDLQDDRARELLYFLKTEDPLDRALSEGSQGLREALGKALLETPGELPPTELEGHLEEILRRSRIRRLKQALQKAVQEGQTIEVERLLVEIQRLKLEMTQVEKGGRP